MTYDANPLPRLRAMVKRHPWWLQLWVLAVVALAAPIPSSSSRPPTEYEIKAAYLYNFTKYVTWPEAAFAPGGGLTVCILGRDPFGDVLDETLRGETIQGRSLAARRIARVEEAAGCHTLFIASSEEAELPRLLKALEKAAVLTVGETEGFAEQGGMIRLRNEEDRVRLEVNPAAAKRAGLVISSQLLKLSRIVEPKTGAKP